MKIEYKEIRIIVGPKLNHVYVWITSDEYMLGVDGWHYKATTKPSLEFLTESFIGKEDPVTWPRSAPPNPSDKEYSRLE